MARHFLDLDGAKTMSTPGFALAERCFSDCQQTLAMGVVEGPSGVGKTFAVDYASARSELEVHWFTFAHRPAISHLVKAMLNQITAVNHHGERFKLTSDLLAVLADKPRLLVVDEAQLLNRDAFEYLRFLHDDRRTQFALLFVGGHGCYRTLARYPMLLARIYRHARLDSLTEDEVVSLVPQYHPVHQQVAVELILRINDSYARGNFRRWAAFTGTIAALCQERKVDSYDEQLAQAALALLPSWEARR